MTVFQTATLVGDGFAGPPPSPLPLVRFQTVVSVMGHVPASILRGQTEAMVVGYILTPSSRAPCSARIQG